MPDLGTVAHGQSSIEVVPSDQGRHPLLRSHVQRHHALGGSRVATDVAVEDCHWHGRRQFESVALALARKGHVLALVFEVPHVILGHQAVAHVLPVLHQEARQAQDHVVVHSVATVALTALDRSVGGRAVGSDTVVHELQFAVLVNTLDLMVHQRHQPVGRAVARADDLGLRLPGVPPLDEQLAGGYARGRVPGRRGQNLGPDGSTAAVGRSSEKVRFLCGRAARSDWGLNSRRHSRL